jgi:beta-alanine--pyruvate transaminase
MAPDEDGGAMSQALNSSHNRPFAHHWMPFTANRAFREQPRVLARAEGIHYWNDRGERLLDGVSGLFCTPAGHGRAEIAEAVGRQLTRLDFAPPFQYGTPGAFELAAGLAQLTPPGLDRIFFVGSGSEAVETAIKVAIQYHRRRGEGQRLRVVGREKAYHGVNFAGWSVGGMVRNREQFGLGMPGALHMRHTDIEANRGRMGQGEHGAELADDLQRFVDLHGADTIAACIVEPVAGSVGVLVPPVGYLQRLREICDRHGILLIFDEVITGFGRMGANFAAQAFGVTPDIMTMAKAITNGAVPMAAVAASRPVHEAIVERAPAEGIEFFHGYTWSAHPVACAAALASLALYREEALFERARALSPYFLDCVASLAELDAVACVRGYGLMAGIDLAPGAAPGARGFEVLNRLFAAGVVARVTNDTVILAPPFVFGRADVDRLVGTLRDVLAAP